MITTWILVASALFALGLLGYVAARNRASRTGIDEAISMIRAIDMEAFRNLIDPDEDAFLRHSLSSSQYRKIKRMRARAALTYVRSAGRAAVLFAKAGQAAQRSSDPQIAKSGIQIAASALRLRMYTLQAGLQLLAAMILAGTSNLPTSALVDRYESTADALLRLGRTRSAQRV